MTSEEAKEILGEGIHTSLRKGSGHKTAEKAHQAISDMPEDEWDSVLSFLVDGLKSMNIELVETARDPAV